MTSNNESLRKAFLPAQLAPKFHPFYRGKIEMAPKCPIRSFDDFAIWYTPGVARLKRSREELYDGARSTIKRAREQAKYLMRSGFIQDFPT